MVSVSHLVTIEVYMRSVFKALCVAGILSLCFIACGGNNKEAKKSEPQTNTQISFSGSSTLAPVIAKISTEFIEKYVTWDKVDTSLPKENITIFVSSGGSGAGVKAVLDGVANFGMLARDIKNSEKEKVKNLQAFTLGIDALCICVNPANAVIAAKNRNLTEEEVIKIFSGEYKVWSDLDASLPNEKIVVVTRDLSGGAHEVFQKKIMKEVKVTKDVIQAPSMGALVAKIIENKNAIGYASFGITNQNSGKLISMQVDTIEPNEENIASGVYKISRPLIIMKSGELTKTEKAFVSLLQSEAGKKVLKGMGFIPADN